LRLVGVDLEKLLDDVADCAGFCQESDTSDPIEREQELYCEVQKSKKGNLVATIVDVVCVRV
jgi:hypothetical protein